MQFVSSCARGSGSSSNPGADPGDSGGPRADQASGASLGKPTCASIFPATRLSVISAIGFMRPPQLGQSKTSMAKTRCISSAHRSPRSRGDAQLRAADDSTRNAALAAVIVLATAIEDTSALVGGGPRPSFTT
jgi:hypothetical protein